MFGLFETPDRRIRDEREIRYFYAKYGDEAVAVLKDRANDSGLSARDRRHWQRLVRKARQKPRDSLGNIRLD